MTLANNKPPYMPKWMPYQFGIWFHDYIKTTCAVCGLSYGHDNPAYSSVTNLKHLVHHGLLCTACHSAITWRPTSTCLELQTVTKHHSTTLATDATITPRVASTVSTHSMQHTHTQPSHFFEPNVPNSDLVAQVQAYSASVYAGIIKQALVAFKYHQRFSALPILVHAIRQLPKPEGCHNKNSLILPTPTTKKRLRTRGFDPVTILSYYLSKHWQIPIWNGVVRVKDQQSQQGLNRQQRKTNVDNAFLLNCLPPPNYRRFILFDDVFTTGSTMQSLALAVHNASHHTQLVAYTIARTYR